MMFYYLKVFAMNISMFFLRLFFKLDKKIIKKMAICAVMESEDELRGRFIYWVIMESFGKSFVRLKERWHRVFVGVSFSFLKTVEGHFFPGPFFPRDHFFPNFDKNMIIYKWGGFFQKVKSAFCRASETASERKKIPPKTKSKFEL